MEQETSLSLLLGSSCFIYIYIYIYIYICVCVCVCVCVCIRRLIVNKIPYLSPDLFLHVIHGNLHTNLIKSDSLVT